MKSLILAGTFATLLPAAASAQSMTCADYLKADQQMTAQMGGAAAMKTGNAAMDAQAAALDKKMKDYCSKNPSATVDKAMEEAMK